jgi:hypothetical protein
MSNKHGFGPHLEEILRKMCEYVAADFDKINFKEERWFLKYTWSNDEENSFKEWLAKYFLENYKARKELLYLPRIKNKKYIYGVADHFIFNYGWKAKYEQ